MGANASDHRCTTCRIIVTLLLAPVADATPPPAPPVAIPKSELHKLRRSFDVEGTGESTDGKPAQATQAQSTATTANQQLPVVTQPTQPAVSPHPQGVALGDRIESLTSKIDAIKQNTIRQNDSTGIKVRW